MKLAATHPVYWGIGGVLVSYGLSKPSSSGRLAATAGVLLLAVKMAEGLYWIARLAHVKSSGHI